MPTCAKTKVEYANSYPHLVSSMVPGDFAKYNLSGTEVIIFCQGGRQIVCLNDWTAYWEADKFVANCYIFPKGTKITIETV